MNRLFSKADKKSVHRIYGHVCSDCGSILSLEEARADHLTSYANGGQTHGSNISLLCDFCNRSKGKKNGEHDVFKVAKPKLSINLRPWQAQCLENQIKMASMGAKDYFVAAGVGSGKTVQALSLYLAGDYDMAIIITPKSGIRGSWQNDANSMGINLQSVISKNDFIGDGDRQLPNGYVLNAQMISSVLNDIKILCQRFKVLIIVDEAHHYGDDMNWTENVTAAVEDAAFLLAMSGTPYRNDGQRIIALKYVKDGNKAVGAPDYERSYEKSLEAGETAPVITRFVSGSITKHDSDTGSVNVYDYKDGDYSFMSGAPNFGLMSERLRLSAVESFDWQMAAIGEARKELMKFRESGFPWAGLIACAAIDQAIELHKRITEQWGDKCLLVVAEADTEDSVAIFNEDESYTWIISITKISEGVNIDRLRVGVLLSTTTTRSNFEQLRGRIVRMVKGIPQISQTGCFYIPADPRLIDYAMYSNKLSLHTVRWLDPKIADDVAVQIHDDMVKVASAGFDGSVGDIGQTTPEQIKELRDQMQKTREQLIIKGGDYTLYAKPAMDGAALGDVFITEAEFESLRLEMAKVIHPLTAARMRGKSLETLKDLFT